MPVRVSDVGIVASANSIRVTDISIATAVASVRVAGVSVETLSSKIRVSDIGVLVSSSKLRVSDIGIQVISSKVRVADISIISAPRQSIGYYGVGSKWVPVTAWVGRSGQWVPVAASAGTGGGWQPASPPSNTPVQSVQGPISFPDLATAQTQLQAPTDANYVVWDPAWTTAGLMLHEAFTTKLGPNDILVLPERVDGLGDPIPYLIDSSNGFMAAGVSSITGQLPNDTVGTRIPIVQNARCWFEMARGRRGIMGMGPNSVIEPSISAFTRSPQPITEQTGGVMKAYNAAGVALQDLVGAQDKLMSFDYADPFVANLTVRGRSFGGMAYTGIATRFAKNLFLDAASRGHAGVPNGETGSLGVNNGTYHFENIQIKTTDSGGTRVVSSPVMWNKTTGGTMINVSSGRPAYGMFTMWRCNGTNTWRDVFIQGDSVGMNLEEGGASFVINWDGGSISTTSKYHIVGESSGGSKKINLRGVTVTGGIVSGNLCSHFYTYTGTYIQKKSDITRDNGFSSYYGFMV